MFIEEYLQRCDRAGFERRARCTIPMDAPWGRRERGRMGAVAALAGVPFPSVAWFRGSRS